MSSSCLKACDATGAWPKRRLKELKESLALFLKGDSTSLSIRLREIRKEIGPQRKTAERCRFAQPYINKYLPDESFKTLVLLLGLVMLGVALKGFFMFLQEVLVADVMQLTLFDIRNLFFGARSTSTWQAFPIMARRS